MVAENLGNTKRSAALKLQSVIYRAPEDWDTVICEYKKLRVTEVKNVVDTLFSEWQTTMAQRSIDDRMDNNVSSDTWIHWLIEASLDMTGKSKWFLKKLDAWLDHLKEDEKLFEQEWSLLARWNETHKRRRNLWREMKKHQLPI